jgi:hypothetical protein
MNTPPDADHMNAHVGTNFSFTPVIARSYGQKPLEWLPAYACSGIRLKPGVNEK